MDEQKARGLLEVDRRETQRRLDELLGEGQADRSAANEPGDMSDSAQPLTQQGTDDAVTEELQRHLEAIDRAERRLEAGTYGHSVRSGLPIPDERLEDDPTAELTVEEAAEES
jgi:DnaK suppressor protein